MRECDLDKYIEIELIAGTRVVLPKRWDKVYDAYEITKTFFKFTNNFPFIIQEKVRCTHFAFKTQYEYAESSDDTRYLANCSIVQLAALFGVKVEPFEKSLVENDLKIQ